MSVEGLTENPSFDETYTPAHEDVIEPVEVDHDEDHEDEGHSASEREANRNRNTRLIRRVSAKAEEVLNASEGARTVAANLVGSSTDLADLTASIMTPGRSNMQPWNDLQKLAEDDPFEAAVTASDFGTARIKRVWALLDSMGLVDTKGLPANQSKAAVQLARTVHQLDMDDVRSDLDEVVELLKRS